MAILRKETLQAIDDSIYYCLVNVLQDSDLVEFNNGKKLEIQETAEYCYQEMIKLTEETSGYSRSIRFDGKKNILKKMRDRIIEILKQENMIDYLNI